MKNSIVLYFQQYEAIKGLPYECKGILLDAVFAYAMTGNVPDDLPPLVSMAFSFIRTAMDIDSEKYEKRCEKNKENIRKRWKDSNEKGSNEYERIPEIQTDTNHTDTDTDNCKLITDTDTESTKVDIKSKTSRFLKPTIEEIESYCLERKNSVNSENFYNFYESKGWMVGKNKMKDWKAAVRTWEKSEKKTSSCEVGITLKNNNPDKYNEKLW